MQREILPALSHFLKEKGQLTEKTREGVIYEALKQIIYSEPSDTRTDQTNTDVITGRKRDWVTITYDRIYDKVRELTDATPSTMPNEHAMYSVEYGKITHRQIINICRKPFGGIDDSLGRDDKKAKALRFDKQMVDTVGKGFEAITEIKILHDNDDNNNDDDDKVGTEERNENENINDDISGNSNKQAHITSDGDGRTELGPIQQINENSHDKAEDKPENIFADNTTNVNVNRNDFEQTTQKNQDYSNCHDYDKPDDKDVSISYTASNSVPQSPSLAKTSRLLKNLQEAEQARKSKQEGEEA